MWFCIFLLAKVNYKTFKNVSNKKREKVGKRWASARNEIREWSPRHQTLQALSISSFPVFERGLVESHPFFVRSSPPSPSFMPFSTPFTPLVIFFIYYDTSSKLNENVSTGTDRNHTCVCVCVCVRLKDPGSSPVRVLRVS